MSSIVPSSLKVFDDNYYSTSMVSHNELILHPINPLSLEQPVEFNCLPSESLKSLSKLQLYGRFQIVKSDLTKYSLTDAIQPTITNCFLNSLIKSIYVTVNQTQVACVENYYAFRHYIETMLTYSNHNVDIQEMQMLYNPDTLIENSKSRIEHSKIFDTIVPLNIFSTPKLLLPHTSIGVKLMFNDKSFVLIEQADNDNVYTKSELKLLELKLIIKQFYLRDTVSLELEHLLLKSPAIYNNKNAIIIPLHLQKDTTVFSLPNAYISALRPAMLITAFLKTAHYSGDSKLNSFNDFSPHGLESFNYLVNEVPVIHESYHIANDETQECVSHLYANCIDALSMRTDNSVNFFSYKRFKKTLFFIINDITSDCSATSDLLQRIETTSIGITGKFGKQLTEPVTALIYILLDSRFLIDQQRIVDKVY